MADAFELGEHNRDLPDERFGRGKLTELNCLDEYRLVLVAEDIRSSNIEGAVT
jgi:hypothetical protein